MAKNKVKKAVKKAAKKKLVKPETTLADIINKADQAVLITTNKGNIEITGLKAINYSFEVKGLLVGALDTYNIRPIISGLNNNARAVISHLVNINGKVDRIVKELDGEEVIEEPKEGKK